MTLILVRKGFRCSGQRLGSPVGWVLGLLPISQVCLCLSPGPKFSTVAGGLAPNREAGGSHEDARLREELAWPPAPELAGKPGCCQRTYCVPKCSWRQEGLRDPNARLMTPRPVCFLQLSSFSSRCLPSCCHQ